MASSRGQSEKRQKSLLVAGFSGPSGEIESDAKTRRGFVTSEVLYQLSYVGA